MNKDQKILTFKFVKFIVAEMGLTLPYTLTLTSTRSDDFKTYAFYDKNGYVIKIYIKNRGLADILRSICHEFQHHKQNQQKRLNGEIPDIGGEIEDEANSVAGQLVKKFGYQYPQIFSM